MNEQTPTKQEHVLTETLLVHSIFNTIQGEGPHVGTPACFVRLAGCNLQCPMCDTEYTKGAQRLYVHELAKTVRNTFPHKLVVITGGEPFRQRLLPFIKQLLARGLHVQIETNGTLDPHEGLTEWFDVVRTLPVDIVCSPKTGRVQKRLLAIMHECQHPALKYVIDSDSFDPTDGLPIRALEHPVHPRIWRDPFDVFPVYIQPADTGNAERNAINQQLAVEISQKFGYRLCLQVHKIIGVP